MNSLHAPLRKDAFELPPPPPFVYLIINTLIKQIIQQESLLPRIFPETSLLLLFRTRTVISSREKRNQPSENGSAAARPAASPLSQAPTSDLRNIAFIFPSKTVLFSNSGPMCFRAMRTNDGSCRTRAPPSLRVAQGVPPPDPGAPTPQHSWRINISHTFSPTTIKTFRTCVPSDPRNTLPGHRDETPRCPQNGPGLPPVPPALPFSGFSLPPDLKIAGNSIFMLLSKNFFLSYRAPLPNSHTSRGVPVPSSPAFWVAAGVEKQYGYDHADH